jgi:hypothetical protein
MVHFHTQNQNKPYCRALHRVNCAFPMYQTAVIFCTEFQTAQYSYVFGTACVAPLLNKMYVLHCPSSAKQGNAIMPPGTSALATGCSPLPWFTIRGFSTRDCTCPYSSLLCCAKLCLPTVFSHSCPFSTQWSQS